MIFLYFLIELLYVAAAVACLQLLGRVLHLSRPLTRKIVHLLVCFVFVFQYRFFYEGGEVSPAAVVVPALVTLALFLVARYRLLPAIVSRENPYGIFYYGLAVTAASVLSVLFPILFLPSGLSFFCLSFGDGFAAIVGMYAPKKHPLFREKTWEGSVACFLFSLVGILVFRLFIPCALSWPAALILAAVTAVLELFGDKLDNLLIVFGVTLGAALLL